MADRTKMEENLALSAIKKYVREIEERKEFGSFEKQTEEQTKAQIELLKRIHTLNQTQREFVNLYNKTEEKRRVDEQRQVRERLQRDGNLKAFLFQQTEGLRKTFHSTWDIKASDMGKGIVKGLGTFGLLGKFDGSSLIRKFDEYKAFTMERREKRTDVELMKRIETMVLKENQSTDDVKRFLQLNGLTSTKIADLLYQFNRNYKEYVDEIVNQGVLRHEDTTTLIEQAKNFKRGSLLGEPTSDFEEEPKEEPKGFILGKQEEFKYVQKRAGIKPPENVDVIRDIEDESLNELVRQGKVMDEMNENIKIQAVVASDEMRLTEEWRNRQKEKIGEGDSKKGNFMDMLGANFISDMITKYALPAILGWVASSGGLAVILGSAGVIGSVATALGYIANQASLKAFFNNPEFMNNVFYRPEAYKLSKTDTTLADIYGVKSELIEKGEKGSTEDAIALREATEIAKKNFFARGSKLTDEQRKRLELARLDDELVRLKETNGTDKQMQDVITQIKTTRERQTQSSNKTSGNRQQGTEQKGGNVTGSYNTTVVQQQKQQSYIDLNDGVCRETGLNFVTSRY